MTHIIELAEVNNLLEVKNIMVKVNQEFHKLNCCLELLAVKDIIADKKYLLKNKIFSCYSEEELNKFIEFMEKKKQEHMLNFCY